MKKLITLALLMTSQLAYSHAGNMTLTVIHTCTNKLTKAVRLTDVHGVCAISENAGHRKIVRAKGDPGTNGANGTVGKRGSKGTDGKSAYQLALDSGYVGQLADWLASLKGDRGDDGLNGADGLNGTNGSNGANGTNGTNGSNGATGPAGPTGPTGPTGPAGPAGALGSFTYKIGDTGPGGGFIFFVDYFDQYAGFTYLEAAPEDASTGIVWCDPAYNSISTLAEWSANAVGRGQANTDEMLISSNCTSGAAYAADAYVESVTATADWFLPSAGEMMLMYTNLRQVGIGDFTYGSYWTSTESNVNQHAWYLDFSKGYQEHNYHGTSFRVRPVRAF